MADEAASNGTGRTEKKAKSGWLGQPGWFYLVVLDAVALLLILIWVVTKNPQNLSEYVAATQWAMQILAFLYLAVALFGMSKSAIAGTELNVVAWGLTLIVALALLNTHWVGAAAIGLVVIAHIIFAKRSKA